MFLTLRAALAPICSTRYQSSEANSGFEWATFYANGAVVWGIPEVLLLIRALGPRNPISGLRIPHRTLRALWVLAYNFAGAILRILESRNQTRAPLERRLRRFLISNSRFKTIREFQYKKMLKQRPGNFFLIPASRSGRTDKLLARYGASS